MIWKEIPPEDGQTSADGSKHTLVKVMDGSVWNLDASDRLSSSFFFSSGCDARKEHQARKPELSDFIEEKNEEAKFTEERVS